MPGPDAGVCGRLLPAAWLWPRLPCGDGSLTAQQGTEEAGHPGELARPLGPLGFARPGLSFKTLGPWAWARPVQVPAQSLPAAGKAASPREGRRRASQAYPVQAPPASPPRALPRPPRCRGRRGEALEGAAAAQTPA